MWNVRVRTSERKRQNPVRYTLRCALDGVVNALGFITNAGHELKFARSERGLRTNIVYILSGSLGGFSLRGNAKRALKRIDEQDADTSGLQP